VCNSVFGKTRLVHPKACFDGNRTIKRGHISTSTEYPGRNKVLASTDKDKTLAKDRPNKGPNKRPEGPNKGSNKGLEGPSGGPTGPSNAPKGPRVGPFYASQLMKRVDYLLDKTGVMLTDHASHRPAQPGHREHESRRSSTPDGSSNKNAERGGNRQGEDVGRARQIRDDVANEKRAGARPRQIRDDVANEKRAGARPRQISGLLKIGPAKDHRELTKDPKKLAKGRKGPSAPNKDQPPERAKAERKPGPLDHRAELAEDHEALAKLQQMFSGVDYQEQKPPPFEGGGVARVGGGSKVGEGSRVDEPETFGHSRPQQQHNPKYSKPSSSVEQQQHNPKYSKPSSSVEQQQHNPKYSKPNSSSHKLTPATSTRGRATRDEGLFPYQAVVNNRGATSVHRGASKGFRLAASVLLKRPERDQGRERKAKGVAVT
jgi:hypothetical protein